MPRYKKLSLKKGPKRVTTISGEIEIRRTYFCPDCGKRVKTVRTQKPQRRIGYTCDKVDLHKSGLEYLWPFEFMRVHNSVELN